MITVEKVLTEGWRNLFKSKAGQSVLILESNVRLTYSGYITSNISAFCNLPVLEK